MLGHSIEDILLTCKFNNQKCAANDFEWIFDRLYGNCYLFNSGQSKKASLIAGSWYGLKLSMYTNNHQKLNIFNSLFGFGSYIRIGNGSYLTDDTFKEISLAPGFITSVSVDRSFKFLLAKPYSRCDIDDEHRDFNSNLYETIYRSQYEYTQELCFVTCYQFELIKVCNCSDPWFINFVKEKDVCETNEQTNCLVDVYNQVFLSSDFIENSCLNICPLECNRTEYKCSLSSSQLDPMWFVDFINDRKNLSNDFMSAKIDLDTVRQSVVSFNVFYDSLSYTLSTESPKFDIVSLLSNIGGALSLFMGVSVMSVVEIFALILDI